MIKSKYFLEYVSNSIDNTINNWLEKNKNIEIISSSMVVNGSYICVLILYKEGGKK